MAGNFRDKKMAFEAAEAALKSGENWLNLQTAPPVPDNTGSNGVWNYASTNVYSYAFWSPVSTTTTNLPGLSSQPKFVIEARGVLTGSGLSKIAEIGANTKTTFNGTTYGYRITSRGVGGTSGSEVLLQSDFEKVY